MSYGINDSGAEYEDKVTSQKVFLEAFEEKKILLAGIDREFMIRIILDRKESDYRSLCSIHGIFVQN